jgi:hypothetical protein
MSVIVAAALGQLPGHVGHSTSAEAEGHLADDFLSHKTTTFVSGMPPLGRIFERMSRILIFIWLPTDPLFGLVACRRDERQTSNL